MRRKIVLTGTKDPEERVILAMELLPEANKVAIAVYPEKSVSEEMDSFLYKEWKNNDSATLPEGYELLDRELNVVDSILPDEIKPGDADLIIRTQAEWQFIVLSTKMKKAFQDELEDFNEAIDNLEAYSGEVWDNLKGFWDKVQNQISERNLFKSHGHELREGTNALFDKMKVLRKEADKEFEKISADSKAFFLETLEKVDEKIASGVRLNSIFDELKDLQAKFRSAKMTKGDRNAIWNLIDTAFKKVKEKKYGEKSGKAGASPVDRLSKRYDGLLNAISKMEKSIQRDQKDLEFEHRRINNSDGQLERQIRQAKITMIEQRFNSKSEKLEDMLKTKTELEHKMKKAAERAAKQEERRRKEVIKEELKAKDDEKIEAQHAQLEEDADKLKAAAENIAAAKTPALATKETENTPVKEAAPKEVPSNNGKDELSTIVDRIATITAIL